MAAPTWTAPYWSQPPSSTHHWNLLEIKQGNLLSSHSLNEIASRRSGCVTFGRMDDSSVVDIVTAHESCSRLHARLAFDSSGHLWLRDFKTNNGTFVNKVRLPTEASGKYEIAKGSKEDGVRGCRGVMGTCYDTMIFHIMHRCIVNSPGLNSSFQSVSWRCVQVWRLNSNILLGGTRRI